MLTTTLEQWLILQTVIEEGSFAKAGTKLYKSQSSISYNIKCLQDSLGIALLQTVGKKAQLTESGSFLLAEAKHLIDLQRRLELHAKMLKEGNKTQIRLAVDTVFSKEILFNSLALCYKTHPEVTVHITELLKTEAVDYLEKQQFDLYIIYLPEILNHLGNFLLDIDFVAVAHHEHPLAQQPNPISTAELTSYPLVSIKNLDSNSPLESYGTNWSFSSIDAAISAVTHKLGYAWLPLEKITPLLTKGILKRLRLEQDMTRKTPIYIVYGNRHDVYDKVIQDYIHILRDCVNPNKIRNKLH